MRARILASASVAALAACAPFEDSGVYKCIPGSGKDCVVADANGWKLDYTVQALGGRDLTGILVAGDTVIAVGPSGLFTYKTTDSPPWTRIDTTGAAYRAAALTTPGTPALWVGGGFGGQPGYSVLTSTLGGSATIPNVGGTTLVSMAPTTVPTSLLWVGTDGGHLAFFDAAAKLWNRPWAAATAASSVAAWGDDAGNGWAVNDAGEIGFVSTKPSVAQVAVCRDAAAAAASGRALHAVAGVAPGVAGVSPGIAVAVGEAGLVLRLDGTLTAVAAGACAAGSAQVTLLRDLGGEDLTSVCATGPDDVIAVGRAGRMVQWGIPAGASAPAWLEISPRPVASDFSSVWCSASDVWATTRDGIVVHVAR